MIIPSPDVVFEQLKPNKFEFKVLIFDGFWICISNKEMISKYLRKLFTLFI
jgi:hypothetical protein